MVSAEFDSTELMSVTTSPAFNEITPWPDNLRGPRSPSEDRVGTRDRVDLELQISCLVHIYVIVVEVVARSGHRNIPGARDEGEAGVCLKGRSLPRMQKRSVPMRAGPEESAVTAI